jgi:hypothetical protein
MIYRGKVKGGVVVLEEGVQLPDGTDVRVEPLEASQPTECDDAVYRLGELAVDTGIPDLAANIDHYLYGHPKVSEGGR